EINAQTQYIYTKLEDIKLEMLKLATENAKMRATQIAGIVGKKIGMPISAESGVFQIRPRYSQEISDYGISDVSSIDKEIVTTVRVKFLFE
ncbi:MAG TPA: SIMPL domain-containing protein, partial [bacterium]|nr:SIMPL domain-containing protein [bacterium]